MLQMRIKILKNLKEDNQLEDDSDEERKNILAPVQRKSTYRTGLANNSSVFSLQQTLKSSK